MKIRVKVDLIREIWNTHIYDSDFLIKKFDSEGLLKKNYFGDVVNYLDDTLEIFESELSRQTKPDLRDDIGLLQVLYIQQDLIEELLYIFKTGKHQDQLHQDKNFKRNREIRNELVGHPLRRDTGNGKLISTTLYHFHRSDSDNLCYLKSSENTNYQTELILESRREIVSRHEIFLNTYLDITIKKLRGELYKYHKKLLIVLARIDKDSFERILELCQSYFDKTVGKGSRYSVESLRMLNEKIHIHDRYRNTIELFLKGLREQLDEELESIAKFCLPQFPDLKVYIRDHEEYVPLDQTSFYELNRYDINKLSEIRDVTYFRFHSARITHKLMSNELLELLHMEANLGNESEYRSAYDYLRKLISNR